VEAFIGIAQENPVQAVQELPEVAGGLGALLVTILLVIFGTLRLGGSAATPTVKKGKEVASAAKEKTEEAVSSATETAKGGATKRTTRSSAE